MACTDTGELTVHEARRVDVKPGDTLIVHIDGRDQLADDEGNFIASYYETSLASRLPGVNVIAVPWRADVTTLAGSA